MAPLIQRLPLFALTAITLVHPSSSTPLELSKSNCTQDDNLPSNSTTFSIKWIDCPKEAEFLPNLECGTLTVPIDWDEPTGPTFELGLVRLPAIPSNKTSKIGSLFINPGGPGESASQIVNAVAAGALQVEELLASFDWIGLDPRGVGISNPVQCNMSIYAERVSLFPKTQEEYDTLVDKNRRFGESCLDMTGPLLEHIDTISVAKDHEAARIALGNEPINYLGISYGSQIGAQYAALFPENIRTLALDGIVQHSGSESYSLLVDSTSYDRSLSHFLTWASSNDTSPLYGQDTEELWFSLLANATNSPIPAPSCDDVVCRSDVNAEEILFKSQGYLLYKEGGVGLSWADFAAALYNATQGDASGLSSDLNASILAPGIAVGCLDWTHESSLTLSSVLAQKHQAESYAPLTQGAGQSWQILHSCIGWPAAVKNPQKKLNITTDTTVLLVNGDSDPSTGYPWAVGMLEEFENAVLVTRRGEGHASFPLGGEAASIIGGYLITGGAPEANIFTVS